MDGLARAKTTGIIAAVISGLAMLMGIAAAHAGGEAQTVANLGMAIGVAIIIVGAGMAMTTLVICAGRKRDEVQAAAQAKLMAMLEQQSTELAEIRQDLRDLGAMVLRSGGQREIKDMAIGLDQISTRLSSLQVVRANNSPDRQPATPNQRRSRRKRPRPVVSPSASDSAPDNIPPAVYAKAYVYIIRQQQGADEPPAPRLRSVRPPRTNDE